MKTKILSGLMILALALAVPYGAQAATRAIADTYTIDGITYYNVNSQNFNSDKRFYVDMISAKHKALGGRSLGDLWLIAALGMGKDVFYPTAASEQLAAQLKQGLLTGESTVGNFHYTYFAPEWSNYDGGYVETNAYFDDYMGYRFMFTVRFSDFTVGALLPADEGLYVSSTTENGSVKNVEASSVKNDTATTVTASQNLTKSITESLTSTVENSSSYSFTEGLKVGFDGIVVKVHQDHQVLNKTIYLALAINMEGYKELLGIWISEHEGASFWAQVLTSAWTASQDFLMR